MLKVNLDKKILFIFLIIFGLNFILAGYFFKKLEIQKISLAEIKKINEILFKETLAFKEFQSKKENYLKENFFEKIKSELTKEKLDFLLVDLSEKKLSLFKEGNLKKVFPILTLGKEGSFWETPVGFYRVESKSKKIFSSIGQVWMPYSLQFQGNFFIHGWPYYPDGSPVSSQFSGGCIRLKTEDAKEIFEEVRIGFPILVIQRDFWPDDFIYQLKIPEIGARAYLAADLKNNFIFLEKNSEKILPIASITKLMTALVATEYINLWKEIKIQKGDLVFTSRPRLKVGEKYTGFDLLYPLLMESSNEAAEVFSRFLGKENFIFLMNEKAKSLGLEKTIFKDTSGQDPGNLSSAKDLFYLAKYLYFNRQFILNVSRGKIYWHLISKDFSDLENFNLFSEKENFIGGKSGKTSFAKETFLSIFEIEFKKEKRPIAILILGSDDFYSETKKILDWIKKNYE